jgi:hypothetical protein
MKRRGTSSDNWFEVDKAGLAKVVARNALQTCKPIFELVQNGWDAPGTTEVKVECIFRNHRIDLTVQDDSPVGFTDLSHAYTLYAASEKANNPELRGRFCFGEKEVFALCERASVETTIGTVRFSARGREVAPEKTRRGSIIHCIIPATREEFESLMSWADKLIPPGHIGTYINGKRLPQLAPEKVITANLKTEVGDEEHGFRFVERQTAVRLHPVQPGQSAWLYEMGIPVAETGDRWHYDIAQKVPLVTDRNAVMPWYLRAVRVAVFNSVHQELTQEDCNHVWVQEAMASKKGGKPEASSEAITSYMRQRFSDKRVSYDPSDPEANKLATSQQYVVVHGGMMPAEIWQTVKAAGAILPAGKVTPSPKPYTPGGRRLRLEMSPTPAMEAVERYAAELAQKILGQSIHTVLANDPSWGFRGTYGPGELVMNVAALGKDWFDLEANRPAIHEFLIHEFGHHFCSDHLSADYHKALCRLGAQIAELAAKGQLPTRT